MFDDGIDPETQDDDAAQALALADEHERAAAPVPGTQPPPFDPNNPVPAAPGSVPIVTQATAFGQQYRNAPIPAGQLAPEGMGPQVSIAPPPYAGPGPVSMDAPASPVASSPDVPTETKPPSPTETKEAETSIGPPPARPKLTGDPTKDVQSNLEWSRQLTDYQTALERKSGEIAKRDADVEGRRAEREAEAERQVATQRQAEQQAYQQQRAQRQQAIDASVAEKAAAYQDLKGGEQKSFAERIGDAVAIALGGVGQGLMLAGHVAGARNEGLEAVNRNIEADHQRRVERLKAATDAVLENRYGLKDAADNHRAALADIDADRAAKYRLVAAEAAEQLKQQGASDQDVKTNAVVVAALKEAAKSEDAIHAREEATQVHRETAAATNKLAGAHLDLAQKTLDATNAQRRETNYEKRREFDIRDEDRHMAKEDKDASKKAKAAEDLDKRTLRDPDTGEDIVVLSRPGAVDKAANQLTASRAYSKGLRDLADDAEKNGRTMPALPIFGNITEASKVRDENYGNVIARGRKALELGVSNNNLQIEHQNVGGSGKGLSSMPSPAVLRKMADQNDEFANERLRSGGKAVNGALPPKEKTGGAPTGPAKPPGDAPGKPPQRVIDQAWRALDDPNASKEIKQQATSALAAAGLL